MDRRWAVIGIVTVLGLLLLGGAWAAGRASAPEGHSSASRGETSGSALRTVDGVAVGVQQSRAGALAAGDAYVAGVAETVLARPVDHRRIVETVFTPSERDYALREARRVRSISPAAVENYAAGGSGIALIGARRLDSYDGAVAELTTWQGGIVWGPSQRPTEAWELIESRLRWDGQRWLVERMRPAARPAPAPAVTRIPRDSVAAQGAFERELRGMTAPTYGTAE